MGIDIQQLFDNVKQQLIDYLVENLEPNQKAIDQTFSSLDEYKQLMIALLDLPQITTKVTQEEEKEEEAPSPTQEPPIEEDVKKGGILSRNLKGGVIQQDGQSIYVPETIIRAIGAEDGDRLIAVQKSNRPDEYHFDILEKNEEPSSTDRVQIDYALVEEQDGMLIARRSVLDGGDDIKIDEYHHSFKISDHDIQSLSIKPNDLVDIAYIKSNPGAHRVIWKHHDDFFEYDVVTRPVKSGAYKDSNSFDPNTSYEQTLDDKNILIIGMEARRAQYEQAINNLGGTMLFLDGNEPEDQFRSCIKKADGVVILISFIRHRASKLAVQLCKELDTPFSTTDSLGINTVVTCAEELVESND